eukprot:7939902-Pyramimonas_sp.AAC.1
MSQAILWLQHSEGERPGGIALGPFRRILWGCLRRFGLAIFSSNILRFRSRFGGCLRRFAGFSTL